LLWKSFWFAQFVQEHKRYTEQVQAWLSESVFICEAFSGDPVGSNAISGDRTRLRSSSLPPAKRSTFPMLKKMMKDSRYYRMIQDHACHNWHMGIPYDQDEFWNKAHDFVQLYV
jgi:hypothetical protein